MRRNEKVSVPNITMDHLHQEVSNISSQSTDCALLWAGNHVFPCLHLRLLTWESPTVSLIGWTWYLLCCHLSLLLMFNKEQKRTASIFENLVKKPTAGPNFCSHDIIWQGTAAANQICEAYIPGRLLCNTVFLLSTLQSLHGKIKWLPKWLWHFPGAICWHFYT